MGRLLKTEGLCNREAKNKWNIKEYETEKNEQLCSDWIDNINNMTRMNSTITQSQTLSLANLPAGETMSQLERLDTLRLAIGRSLHPALVDQSKANATNSKFGLVVADRGTCGLVGDSFASNDGSSKYLRGSYIPVSASAKVAGALSDPSTLSVHDHSALTFVSKRELPGHIIIGNNIISGETPKIISSIGMGKNLDICTTVPPNHINVQNKAELLQYAAIATLCHFGRWFDFGFDLSQINLTLPLQNPQLNSVALDALNHKVGKAFFDILKTVGHRGISIGESFTFGKLASLLQAHADPEQLGLLYGWYHPSYKVTVGVPERNVSDELIAEPETVELAAKGLLDTVSGESRTAFATSGWANFWKAGEADYFSVALADRHAGSEKTYSIRMTVQASQAFPVSPSRREFTRQLGVTASLYLLGLLIQDQYTSYDVASLVQTLKTELETSGDVQLKVS